MTVNTQDVKNDVSAALSLSLAIKHEVLAGHAGCPYLTSGVVDKSINGLVRLLGRLEDGTNNLVDHDNP